MFSNLLSLPFWWSKGHRVVIQVQTHRRGGRSRRHEEAAACCSADRQTDRTSQKDQSSLTLPYSIHCNIYRLRLMLPNRAETWKTQPPPTIRNNPAQKCKNLHIKSVWESSIWDRPETNLLKKDKKRTTVETTTDFVFFRQVCSIFGKTSLLRRCKFGLIGHKYTCLCWSKCINLWAVLPTSYDSHLSVLNTGLQKLKHNPT